MTNEERKAAFEAIIYAADEPATIEQLAKALGDEKLGGAGSRSTTWWRAMLPRSAALRFGRLPAATSCIRSRSITMWCGDSSRVCGRPCD